MVRSAAATAGISVYWPLWLVCVCGIILVAFALFALMLLKGQSDIPTARKWFRPGPGKKRERQQTELSADRNIELRFFRIGRDADAQIAQIVTGQWFSVGSGKDADICLAADDRKLAQKHFRLCISGDVLTVAALEKETFVNGVPIRQRNNVPVQSGDLIRAGSHEYRVMFSMCEEKESAT